MNRVESIEKEVQALSSQDLAAFREWFLDYDATVWDQQLEQDAHTGRLDGLADEMRRPKLTGNGRPLSFEAHRLASVLGVLPRTAA